MGVTYWLTGTAVLANAGLRWGAAVIHGLARDRTAPLSRNNAPATRAASRPPLQSPVDRSQRADHLPVIKPDVPMPRKSPDPLADHLARGRIGMAQCRAGQEFRRIFELADKRREGSCGLADDQTAAWKSLAACYRALGSNGSAVVHSALIDGMNAREIAEARGTRGAGGERFYRRRLEECLGCLADVWIRAEKETSHGLRTPTISAIATIARRSR